MTQFDETKEYEALLDIYVHEVAAQNFYKQTVTNFTDKISAKKQSKMIYNHHAAHALGIAEILNETFFGIAPSDRKTTLFDHFFTVPLLNAKDIFITCYFIELILHEHYQQLSGALPYTFFHQALQTNLINIKKHISYLHNAIQKYDNLLDIYTYHLPIINIYQQAIRHINAPFIRQQLENFLMEHKIYSNKLLNHILKLDIIIPPRSDKNLLTFISNIITHLNNDEEIIIWNMIQIAEQIINQHFQKNICHKQFPLAIKKFISNYITNSKKRKLSFYKI